MYIIIICIVFQCFCSVFLMNKRVCHYYYSGRRVARVLLFNSTGDRKPQLLLSSLWVHNSLSVYYRVFPLTWQVREFYLL